jgi:hypothetical protein
VNFLEGPKALLYVSECVYEEHYFNVLSLHVLTIAWYVKPASADFSSLHSLFLSSV